MLLHGLVVVAFVGWLRDGWNGRWLSDHWSGRWLSDHDEYLYVGVVCGHLLLILWLNHFVKVLIISCAVKLA